jgi:hypothetical protein
MMMSDFFKDEKLPPYLRTINSKEGSPERCRKFDAGVD